MTGDQLSRSLHEIATVVGQRGARLCDVTIDVTAGVVTTTDNLPDTGKKVRKN